MSTYEGSRQFLQQESSDGVSLYTHLANVLLKVLSERPSDASAVFEHLSASVKEGTVKPDSTTPSMGQQSAAAEQLKWAQSNQALFAVPDEPPEGGAVVPDMLDEANMWEWGGVSFGRLETYRLYLSVKKLAESLPGEHESLRFWGKITTRGDDYVVVEGKALDETLGEFDEALQEGKDGGNRCTYWVARSPGREWKELPPVTQAQITAARKIKRYFTGDLESPVQGYPPFPGTEINLLRAQIARITAGACVSPAGFFEVDEDAEPASIKVAEDESINEAFPKAVEELMTTDGWVHHEFELNTLGRCRPMPEKLDDEGNPIEEEDPPEEVAPLRSLAEDSEGSWGFRTCPAGAGQSANAMVVAKSLRWPGAIAVAFGKRFTNVYSGDGVKFGGEGPFQPSLPPMLQPEWTPGEDEEGLVEQADVLVDPNPPEGEEEEDE
ncbi:putative: flagellar radial spoke protein 4 [Ectocarpus siliculosus]|uniref:Putative: flagellar radial spoke protein 4 n=1 Tax=Ectocarpus siliculosus TaxID=2880 RepID=D7FS43_ECTSI|nr:putative: flagellar radial spoke protein 4 [Ectocarpus siliculosus]|eukprot:CBJ30984.1 putative: flagellar radial spoke protein 4 [Ectocarpus siliculosus]